MEIFFIVLGIFLLNLRTWCGKNRHYYIIDDNVRRWGYLYIIPEISPPPSFFSTQPHPWRHLFLSITHALNTIVVNLLFGWEVALLFAFHPIAVNCTAWITGGYYSVTMFLSLIAYLFVTHYPNIWGALLGSLFFTASLGSTINCIGLPFLFILTSNPWGLMFFWPLAMYLFGKRFRTGFGIRNRGKKDKITWRKIAVMTKVMAYYIRIMLWPDKLAFFRKFGHDYNRNDESKKEMDSFNGFFWMSLLVVAVFTFVGWQFSPLGTLWFLITLAPFTQFKLLGQFVAERYLYYPSLGIALILANAVQNPVFLAVIATAFIYRSHIYIPAFRTIEDLYKNGVKTYPECISNYANLGERWLHVGELYRSFRILEEALRLEPASFLVNCNLAAYWVSVKHFKRALHHSEVALSDRTQGDLANRVLGNQYKALKEVIKKIDEAVDEKKKEEIRNATEVVTFQPGAQEQLV